MKCIDHLEHSLLFRCRKGLAENTGNRRRSCQSSDKLDHRITFEDPVDLSDLLRIISVEILPDNDIPNARELFFGNSHVRRLPIRLGSGDIDKIHRRQIENGMAEA